MEINRIKIHNGRISDRGPKNVVCHHPRKTFMRKIRGVKNIHYLKLKFRVEEGIGIIRGDQKVAITCFAISSIRSYCITTGCGRVIKNDKKKQNKESKPEGSRTNSQTCRKIGINIVQPTKT